MAHGEGAFLVGTSARAQALSKPQGHAGRLTS